MRQIDVVTALLNDLEQFKNIVPNEFQLNEFLKVNNFDNHLKFLRKQLIDNYPDAEPLDQLKLNTWKFKVEEWKRHKSRAQNLLEYLNANKEFLEKTAKLTKRI